MNITSEELLKEARALEPQLQQWRRTLHRHPEVGFDLPHTKELVKKALTEMGYEPKDCGKAGVIALAGGKKPGKTILLRADMDALPIPEDSVKSSARKFPARCMAAATICIRPCCWVQRSCSRPMRTSWKERSSWNSSLLKKFSRVPQI